jgi:predicted SnoaL-like aldol condensation-catalyzing enzyme
VKVNMDAKQQVRALLKSIETGEPGPIASINPQKYVQHNLGVADGLAGFVAQVAQLPTGSAKVETVRIFQDGDFVFAHTDYDLFGPKIRFDIFRFEGGKIVEHWDNLQEKPSAPNPSGRTMTDGVSESQDLEHTEMNKTIVARFMGDVVVNGRMEKLDDYFDGDRFIQHNPTICDGVTGVGREIEAMAKAGFTRTYDRVHKVLGEGDFVLTASEGIFFGKHVAFYDLFRVQRGKIAEHWDVIEPIPPRDQWKNPNGKF